MEMEQPCCALSFVESVKDVISEIKDVLGSNLTEEQREKILKNFYRLQEAFACFQKQAEHPELVLAMTGTTSSGKSTLANFLIGEAILPTAVQEMSAGLVRVKHSHKRRLKEDQRREEIINETWTCAYADEFEKCLYITYC